MSEKIYDNALEDAENPNVIQNTLWGKIYVDASYWHFPGGGASPEPYDPQNTEHTTKRPAVKVSLQLEPLPELQLAFEQKLNIFTFSDDYVKVVLPSIKSLNLTKDGKNVLKALHNQWCRIERVEGFQQNKKNPDRNYLTWKFEKVFSNEDECRNDYLSQFYPDSNSSSKSKPTDPKIENALAFAKIFVDEACKKAKGNRSIIEGFLKAKFDMNPDVGNYLKVDSPEIQEMIDEWLPEELR